MATAADFATIAAQVRRLYAEQLYKGLPGLVGTINGAARALFDRPADHATAIRWRDLQAAFQQHGNSWLRGMASALRDALANGSMATRTGVIGSTAVGGAGGALSLVDDDTIEREIIGSRLALAIMDRASWEFSDLRSRMSMLEGREELGSNDLLRAHVLARIVIDAWCAAPLPLAGWRELQPTLQEEFSALVAEAYHEANRWLMSQRVMPQVNLRPMIKRSVTNPASTTGFGAAPASGMGDPFGHSAGDAGHGAGPASGYGPGHSGFAATRSSSGAYSGSSGGFDSRQQGFGDPSRSRSASFERGTSGRPGSGAADARGARAGTGAGRPPPAGADPRGVRAPQGGGRADDSAYQSSMRGAHPGAGSRDGDAAASRRGAIADETRLMTRSAPLARRADHAEAVLGRLNRLVGRQLPEFPQTGAAHTRPASPGLVAAIGQAQEGLQRRFDHSAAAAGPGAPLAPQALVEDLQQRKQALKQVAKTPVERATIEIVALLFQAILTEEAIPAAVRVWFARLQMPVLRVAVTEPDFFATADHPARKLIDRMGACVMGFDTSSRAVGDTLEKEIKRIVQVVEAYPDTGRRVFQTVLTEFEKFLEHYFSSENATTRRGISLAQQVEQRETLAIQYTIELRKMLNEVPVQDGVRQFLFQVWADVLAMTALKQGAHGESTKAMRSAAADLIWSASAKVSREDRADVIRRLPPLLKTLREGMASAGIPADKQEEHVRALNNSLAAAFTAKAAAIPQERFDDLRERLESLEELLPDAAVADAEIDEAVVRDLSGHESAEFEVVADGGSLPTPAMLAWARELQVGSWYMLDYRGRNESVQLAWHGLKRQLSLFVAPNGRCILFQQHRLAAFLQAGLLLPAHDESLTVRATRSALARLDVDPTRLLH